MFRRHAQISWPAFLATLFAVTGLGATTSSTAQSTVPAAYANVFGNWYPKPHKTHVNTYHFYAHISLPEPGSDEAGGTAVFGLFDSGEIQMLSYAEYLPSLTTATTKRLLAPSKRLLLDELPRYVMACSWATEEGRVTGTRYVAFAERDDANAIPAGDSVPSYITLSVDWVSIPAKRVESKFAERDYCDEIAQTKLSSAVSWMPSKKK